MQASRRMYLVYKIGISCFILSVLVSSVSGQVECLSLDGVMSRSSIIILGDVKQVVQTYTDQPQMYNDPTESQYNTTVFALSIIRLAKGYSVSPIYVIGDELNSNTTLVVGQRYVLFLSNLKDSCAPSPPYSPCTLPSTPPSTTFYIQPEGKFRVTNNVLYYEYQTGGPCSPPSNGMSLDQFMARIYYPPHEAVLTVATALLLAVGSGTLFYRRSTTGKTCNS